MPVRKIRGKNFYALEKYVERICKIYKDKDPPFRLQISSPQLEILVQKSQVRSLLPGGSFACTCSQSYSRKACGIAIADRSAPQILHSCPWVNTNITCVTSDCLRMSLESCKNHHKHKVKILCDYCSLLYLNRK